MIFPTKNRNISELSNFSIFHISTLCSKFTIHISTATNAFDFSTGSLCSVLSVFLLLPIFRRPVENINNVKKHDNDQNIKIS